MRRILLLALVLAAPLWFMVAQDGSAAALSQRTVDLLDSDRLLNQLVGLERRTARGGRDSIDHAPGGHDDLANAVAGVVAMLAKPRGYDSTLSWV